MKYTGNAASDPNATFPEQEGCFLTCTHVEHLDDAGNPKTSKAGNNMWVLEMTVAEGPSQDRKMWHYLVWIPAGKPGHGMTLKALKAFGLNPEGENDILPEHLLNVTVKADVIIEPGTGGFEPSNRISKWYTPDVLAKPGEDPNGSAQAPGDAATDFDPKKLEKAATPPPPPAPVKKPLWGAGKPK